LAFKWNTLSLLAVAVVVVSAQWAAAVAALAACAQPAAWPYRLAATP
jgi:hypothetical protein